MASPPVENCGQFFGEWPKDNNTTNNINNNNNAEQKLNFSNNNAHPRLGSARLKRFHSYTTSFVQIPEDQEIDINSSQQDILQDCVVKNRRNFSSSKQKSFDDIGNSRNNNDSHLSSRIWNFLLFWPKLALHLTSIALRYLLFLPLLIAAPSFWLSALLWIFWKFMRFPISILKWILVSIETMIGNSDENDIQNNNGRGSGGGGGGSGGGKRTVLISCGSTIQTLHLARDFYSSGARVIVFEFEGLFGLARFSTAVEKFYVVPKPTADNPDNYISALCHIVDKEKPSFYIPVCATSPAYYDALAKPHLELLGCATFIPALQETIILDDTLKIFKKCAQKKIQLPPYEILTSKNQLQRLYESGFIGSYRNIMMAVGMHGLFERYKYIVPNSLRDFKFSHEISDEQQWLIVRDIPGEHYVTCTTVKDSKVIANVSCIVDHVTKNLIPIATTNSNGVNGDNNNNNNTLEFDIRKWIKEFFAKIRMQRYINGHISFRLVKCQSTGQFIPLGIRVGVSLPYISSNTSHACLLRKPTNCVHQRHSNSESNGLNLSGLKLPIPSSSSTSSSIALDKREALFAYWDPLPYCAYYHFQLPLQSVKIFLQKRSQSSNTSGISPRTVPVR